MIIPREQCINYVEALRIAIDVLDTYKIHLENCSEASNRLKELQKILINHNGYYIGR